MDEYGDLWVGTSSGLAKFDGASWTVFNEENSGLPYDAVHELIFDKDGVLWVGTGQF